MTAPLVEYRQIALGDALYDSLPGCEDYWEDGQGSGIWRFENDVAVEFIGHDGGEPEDQTLDRDFRWVNLAIIKAYALGYKHSAQDGRARRVKYEESGS